MASKLISYIFPIYNEEGNVDLLYSTIDKVTQSLKAKYELEFVFVNDGSCDTSLDKLVSLSERDDRVKVIDFSRNFGHQIAVTAGLDHSNGDAAIIMDADLQDPPEVSLELIKKWEDGYDVVYAQRRSRKDTIFKRLTAHWYYWTLQKLADIHIPRNTADFRLIDRKIVEALKTFPEHDRFLRGLVSFVGFKQTAVLFDRQERHAGKTGYPLRKMIRFAVDGILGFSSMPLKLISRVGMGISLLSLFGIFYAVFMKIFRPDVTVEGWTLMIISVLFIGGIQLVMLGVLGSYIGRIYTESQRRPLYIVNRVIDKRKNQNVT